jgi:hypothetical protein
MFVLIFAHVAFINVRFPLNWILFWCLVKFKISPSSLIHISEYEYKFVNTNMFFYYMYKQLLHSGLHYWYDLSKNMDCDNLYPVFLLYNGGVLNGFGWALGMDLKDYSPRIEHPPQSSYGVSLENKHINTPKHSNPNTIVPAWCGCNVGLHGPHFVVTPCRCITSFAFLVRNFHCAATLCLILVSHL